MARKKENSLQTFRNLFRNLRKQENLKWIYYLYGEESFLIDLIQDEIEKLIPDDQKDFNFDLMYGAETTPEKILSVARSYPMMAENRVVIVREFMKLDEPPKQGNGTGELVEYIKQPNPTTILCLIDKKFPDKRTGLGKELNKISKSRDEIAHFEFSKPDENQLPSWVTDWTRHAHKMTINAEAAQVLSQLVGQNLKLLSTEIEKLCTFVDTDTTIEVEHVKKITESYRDYNTIELKNAVINRDLDKSLHIAEQMLLQSNNNTGEIFKTVGFFYSVFNNIWQICRLADKGLAKDQIQKELGIKNSYIFNLQYREASNFSLAEMPHIFEALLDADRAVKGFSTLDTPSIFLLMVKRIVG